MIIVFHKEIRHNVCLFKTTVLVKRNRQWAVTGAQLQGMMGLCVCLCDMIQHGSAIAFSVMGRIHRQVFDLQHPVSLIGDHTDRFHAEALRHGRQGGFGDGAAVFLRFTRADCGLHFGKKLIY